MTQAHIREAYSGLGEDTPARVRIAYEIMAKAMDTTKLVRVQRSVQSKNGTYMAGRWVRPEQVKRGDRVVGNHAVYESWKKENGTAEKKTSAKPSGQAGDHGSGSAGGTAAANPMKKLNAWEKKKQKQSAKPEPTRTVNSETRPAAKPKGASAPKPEAAPSGTVSARDFRSAVLAAVSKVQRGDSPNKALSGVNISVKNGTMTMVACDGFRLGRYSRPAPDVQDGEITVSAKELRNYAKTLKLADGDVRVAFEDGSLILDQGDAQHSAVLKPHVKEYIDYDSIVRRACDKPRPGSARGSLTVSRKALLDAVKDMKSAAKDGIVLTSDNDGRVTLEPRHGGSGEHAARSIGAEGGEHFRMGINPKYLADALNSVTDETITLNYTYKTASPVTEGSLAPLTFSSRHNDDLNVVLPINLGPRR